MPTEYRPPAPARPRKVAKNSIGLGVILPIAPAQKRKERGQSPSILAQGSALAGVNKVASAIEKRKARNFMFKKIIQNIIDIYTLIKVMKSVKYEGHLKYRRFCVDDLYE